MTEQPPPPASPPSPPPPPSSVAPSGAPSPSTPPGRRKALLVAAVAVVAVASVGAGFVVVQQLEGDDEDSQVTVASTSAAPAPTATASVPTIPPSAPTDLPSPSDAPAPAVTSAPTETAVPAPGEASSTQPPAGRVVAVGSPEVAVFVPQPWERASPPDPGPDLFLRNAGVTTRVFTSSGDPGRPATAVLDEQRGTYLAAERYPGVRTGSTEEIEPFGALTSVGVQYYRGQWVKNGTRVPVDGLVYAAIRGDGTVLILQVEGLRDVESRFDDWQPVVDTTFDLLAKG